MGLIKPSTSKGLGFGVRFKSPGLWPEPRELQIRKQHSLLKLNPKALRTHIFRLLGPKTIQYKAFRLS